METLEKPLEAAPLGSISSAATPETHADQTRIAIADAAGESIRLLRELKLSRPEENLRALENALRQNRFTVLVCGEAKRGKSTFINALIGRNLLPTDVDIATSQVFQIRSGAPPFDQLAFQVRYEDESAHYIEQDELAKYGSQVVQDNLERAGKLPVTPAEKIVRQVEVTVPSGNLPPELTLLDTPGIGSLFSGHARITYRFIPQADAVIFVLDSQAPITEPELVFLSEIMTVTQNIFFLQTRIDQFQQKDWREVYERNRQILTEKFGKELSSPNDPENGVAVWPVSSQNKLMATRTRSRELLQVSRFPVMMQALRHFLFETTGAQRAKNALNKLKLLKQELQSVLEERAGVLEGGEKSRQIADGRKKRLEAFASEWGPKSSWRTLTDARINDRLDQARVSFHAAIASGSALEVDLLRKINALKDIADAERLARSLSSEAVERVNRIWEQTTEDTTNAVSELISPLCGKLRGEAALMSHFFAQNLSVEEVTAAEHTERVKDTLANRARIAWHESGVLGGVGAAVSMVLGRLFSRTPATEGRSTHFSRSNADLADKVKPELIEYLQNVLGEIRTMYRTGESAEESRTETFFTRLSGAASDAMDSEYGRRLLEEQDDARKLFELASITGEAAIVTKAQTEHGLAAWEEWGEKLRVLEDSLAQATETPLETSPVSVTIAVPAPAAAPVPVPDTVVVTAPISKTELELTPQMQYHIRLREALQKNGGADQELPDTLLDELDDFAASLGLTRSQIRETERAVRKELDGGG